MPTTYSFITEPFRYADKFDNAVRSTYGLARQVELASTFTNMTDADYEAGVLFDILKAPRQRFEVVVLGVNVVNLSMYDGGIPCATLLSDRFNLQSGKLVAIPEFVLNLGEGQTILRCWG